MRPTVRRFVPITRFQFEIASVAAILIIVRSAPNEAVAVFDRIREAKPRARATGKAAA